MDIVGFGKTQHHEYFKKKKKRLSPKCKTRKQMANLVYLYKADEKNIIVKRINCNRMHMPDIYIMAIGQYMEILHATNTTDMIPTLLYVMQVMGPDRLCLHNPVHDKNSKRFHLLVATALPVREHLPVQGRSSLDFHLKFLQIANLQDVKKNRKFLIEKSYTEEKYLMLLKFELKTITKYNIKNFVFNFQILEGKMVFIFFCIRRRKEVATLKMICLK
ncbi:hypothetical protein AGLY_003000 [Aphis glycines]|uniref:Uncharacterized protein n=1 Tax=Aphis glycines TaxID=307491 RepID=A0A6G0U387_APHGL|nr:hypothetical protein AGLY_003000 [Aphis glycines]